MRYGQADQIVSGVDERALVSALAARDRRFQASEEALNMVRMLSILFAGWVVNRVMAENRIRNPIALLPPPGRKRRGRPQRERERHPQ
jgi:hypothetical protein